MELLLLARAAWKWLRENCGFVLLCLIGAFTGARLLKRKDSEVSSLKDALAVQKHKNAIDTLRARRDQVLEADALSVKRDIHLTAEQKYLEERIVEKKRAVAALHKKTRGLEGLTDAEVEEVFRDAGL